MSIVDVDLAWTGATGSLERGFKSEYTSVYNVTTDNANDQAQVILAYFKFAGNVPSIGTIYYYANDLDTTAFCDRITPTRKLGSAFHWEVECHFSQPGRHDQQGQKEDGSPTENPLEFRHEIGFSTQFRSLAAEKAEYIEGMTGDSENKKLQFPIGPATNSSGEVYDPPLEYEDALQVITITKNVESFPSAQLSTYHNRVNISDFTINKPSYGLVLQVPKHRGKLAIEGNFDILNNTPFWRVTYQLTIDWHSEKGWRPQIVDRGFHARAFSSDADGLGGTYTSAQLVEGLPKLRRLLDPQQEPLNEPVNLDGEGQPLDFGLEPVYLTYRVLKEADFEFLNL